jgi:hypothetical protein
MHPPAPIAPYGSLTIQLFFLLLLALVLTVERQLARWLRAVRA